MAVVNVLVTTTEKRAIEAAAKRAKLSVSAWLRLVSLVAAGGLEVEPVAATARGGGSDDPQRLQVAGYRCPRCRRWRSWCVWHRKHTAANRCECFAARGPEAGTR